MYLIYLLFKITNKHKKIEDTIYINFNRVWDYQI